MSVQADWGLQALQRSDVGTVDPFGMASSLPFMLDGMTAPPDWMFDVSMDTEQEELLRLLGLTRRSQNRMMTQGIDCPIRWKQGSSCLACPLNAANDPDSPKSHLCRTSTQEERLETVLAAQSDGG